MLQKSRDMREEPFRRMVILGESTVEGGPWLNDRSERFADIVANLVITCQGAPVNYVNKGIGANAISPRSPGYEASVKPSAMERFEEDVVANRPDLFVCCYGLNDMRAGMDVNDFGEDLSTIVGAVKAACAPMIVLTTVYYMTGWKSYPPFDRGSVALTEQYNTRIRAVAEEHGAAVADVWEGEQGADWLIHPDGVHANRVGNLVIAHRVFEAIARHASGLAAHAFAQGAETNWTRDTTSARKKHGDPFVKTW